MPEYILGLDFEFEIIDRRRREPGCVRDDLPTLLLGARDEETGRGLTDREVRDQFCPAIKALSSSWPIERPANGTTRANTRLSAKELARVRASVERGRPYGGDE